MRFIALWSTTIFPLRFMGNVTVVFIYIALLVRIKISTKDLVVSYFKLMTLA
ncbi:hypothetical protein ALP07_200009 [Pseudomonas savastanoi pv. glycinea]|nr:hypothetical protein PsgRace4_13298 [Pseudomonas savastanoi pv. glycinea str. race 4]RMV73137.1 hypothetical protein ALP07_200009 [Pseudomonas savastanoi pv. glycinea]